jgi:hypothetical protein
MEDRRRDRIGALKPVPGTNRTIAKRQNGAFDPFETYQLPPSKFDAINWVYKTNPYLTPAIPAQPSDMSGKSTRNAAIPDKHRLNWLPVSERD